MCAQFMVQGPARAIADRYFAKLSPELASRVYDDRVVPFHKAPVLVDIDGQRWLKEMRFHLTPRWAKEAKVKWATYNARIEGIEEKASFRHAFRHKHCVVLLNGFVEAIYLGEHAGYMVQFRRRDDDLIPAAGIFDEWVDPKTGEVLESFAILTDVPEPFVELNGHDREPIFVKDQDISGWLQSGGREPEILRGWLRDHREPQDLKVTRDRAMRPGWEKRIPKDDE